MLEIIRRNKLAALLLAGAAFLVAAGGLSSLPDDPGPAPPTVAPPAPNAAGLSLNIDRWTDASVPGGQRRLPTFHAPKLGIVGGTTANWQDHPGAVRMQAVTTDTETSYGGQLCGGTAIHRRWIITAAHCVEGEGIQRFDFWYGSNAWRDADMVHGFRAYQHPAYREFGLSGDAALVYLEEPLPADFPLARLATVDEYRTLTEGAAMVARGWGTTRGAVDGGRDPSATLQEVRLKIRKAGELVAEVVSRDGEERGPCQGDSGGGLILEGGDPSVIYGPLSFVRPTDAGVCLGRGYIAGYTSATLVRAF